MENERNIEYKVKKRRVSLPLIINSESLIRATRISLGGDICVMKVWKMAFRMANIYAERRE